MDDDKTKNVTLKELCGELKLDPIEARVKLRAAVAAKKLMHKAKQPWVWPKSSPAIKTVRAILESSPE